MISALLCALLVLQPPAGAPPPVAGTVRDASGGVIAGASVRLEAAGGHEQQTRTAADGRFHFAHPPADPQQLVVSAPGFAERRVPIVSGEPAEVVLAPAGPLETVTVTPTRTDTRLGNVPASVSVITRRDIEASPAVVADDLLRQLPEFSLFRRSSSLVSHPTAQGVSLRGIGPSGVSRTLVLLDGVPFNDPFGGWVYWTKVPMDSLQQVEVVDSPSSSLYGNYGMGGVINLVTRPPAPHTFELTSQYGSRRSPELDSAGQQRLGPARGARQRPALPDQRISRRRAGRARPRGQQRGGRLRSGEREARFQADRQRAAVRPGRLLRREPPEWQGQHHQRRRRGERHALEVGRAAACGRSWRTRASCRRRRSGNSSAFTAPSSPCRRRRLPAASAACPSTSTCRRPPPADRCSGRRRSASRRS